MPEIVIIGAGAAGLMAAGTALKQGASVCLIEKNEKPGRKLMITGKGRCNVTHYTGDIRTLIENTPTNGRFLYSAFSAFMPEQTIALFESLGVPLKVERGDRVFPVSDKAVDIVDALRRFSAGARFVHARVRALESKNDTITAAVLEDGTKISGDRFILATGGASYPLTGSTGDGYRIAEALNHRVCALRPSLVALKSSSGYCARLQGLSLKNVSFSLFANDRKKPIFSEIGEMLFTHFGLSGPLVLSASAHIKSFEKDTYFALVDLKPGLDEIKLEKRILRDFEKYSNKDIINALGDLLPKKMIPVMISYAQIDPRKKVNQISKSERLALVRAIKKFRLPLTDFWSLDSAVITSGGVSVKEIDPKTMRSKLYDNLYFAGEIMDVDAFTGGFNLQIAFSTGYAAAMAASEQLFNET